MSVTLKTKEVIEIMQLQQKLFWLSWLIAGCCFVLGLVFGTMINLMG